MMTEEDLGATNNRAKPLPPRSDSKYSRQLTTRASYAALAMHTRISIKHVLWMI
jgi:hypothetical protein